MPCKRPTRNFSYAVQCTFLHTHVRLIVKAPIRIKHTNVRTVNGIRQANSTDSIQTTNISSSADTRTHSRRRPHQVWNGIPDRSWLCHTPMRPRQLCNSCNMRRQHCRLKPNFLNMLTIPQCSLGWPRETSWQYFVADFGRAAARRQLGDYRPGAVRHHHWYSVRHSIVQDG